jgi:glycogen debranching enzyme
MSALDQPWLHELVTVLSAPTVALSDYGGQIRPEGAQGVLHADVRVLSQAVLKVDGVEPAPISGGLLGAERARFVSVPRAQGDDIVDPTVRVERERTVTPGEVRESIRVVSFADAGVNAELTLAVATDMAGLTEIKGARADSAPVAPLRTEAGLSWAKDSLRATLSAPGATVALSDAEPADAGARPASADARPASADAATPGPYAILRWPVRLHGRGTHEVTWRLSVTDPSAVVVAAPPAETAAQAKASANADDSRLPNLLRQSLADADALRMAVPRAPGDVFLAAGAPWYFTLFGRDSIWAARLLLPFGWRLAAGTLRALAAFQGRHVDAETAQAPGKIPHELRRSGVYYGTIDATPLWICLLHDAWRWGMPETEVAALLPNLRAALEWMREFGDSDGDGLLEYIDESGHGLSNQGWKDSGDSVRFADGTIARAPVALCEVQGYAYEAAVRGADLLARFGTGKAGTGEAAAGGSKAGEAAQWRDWAARLAESFRGAFWVTGKSGSYPALALDADKRPVDSLTSNIGHLLGTGLLSRAEESLVAGQLVAADMDSGFGLRTMSDGSGGYNPLSYHCGSVWSHDTAIVIRGLFRSGHTTLATPLADGLLSAASSFGWRLPELYSGEARSQAPWPTPYPAACRPQAWSAAAAGALLQALLGLDADVPGGTVTIRPPGVRIGGAGVRLHVDGLVAGNETFSAGVDESGRGYVLGCSLKLGPREQRGQRHL